RYLRSAPTRARPSAAAGCGTRPRSAPGGRGDGSARHGGVLYRYHRAARVLAAGGRAGIRSRYEHGHRQTLAANSQQPAASSERHAQPARRQAAQAARKRAWFMQSVSTVSLPSIRARLAAYVNLMKPHVTVLLLGTTLAAMAVASSGHLMLVATLATMIGGAMAAGSANAINCYWDRDIDVVMARTRTRTLPSGRLAEVQALTFGLALGTASFAVFSIFVNLLSALLALSAIVFYVVVYTMWLKRTTPQNIVIGGAAGAVPVLVGWAAVTNSVGLAAVWMFLIIFLWTPPHFWALSLLLKQDYPP